MLIFECRSAIAWATWDLIAMVENGKHDGPATHAVTFVWIGHEVMNGFRPFSFTVLLFLDAMRNYYIAYGRERRLEPLFYIVGGGSLILTHWVITSVCIN